MKYLLIEHLGYEGDDFYSFESNQTLEELNKDLYFCRLNNKEFMGVRLSKYLDYEVESLEEWWKSHKC